MQAIQTKYHGPTNHTGSRFTARCDAGRVTVPYNHAEGIEENHKRAAATLARKLGWAVRSTGKVESFVSGSLPDGSYCHVFTTRADGWTVAEVLAGPVG